MSNHQASDQASKASFEAIVEALRVRYRLDTREEVVRRAVALLDVLTTAAAGENEITVQAGSRSIRLALR